MMNSTMAPWATTCTPPGDNEPPVPPITTGVTVRLPSEAKIAVTSTSPMMFASVRGLSVAPSLQWRKKWPGSAVAKTSGPVPPEITCGSNTTAWSLTLPPVPAVQVSEYIASLGTNSASTEQCSVSGWVVYTLPCSEPPQVPATPAIAKPGP